MSTRSLIGLVNSNTGHCKVIYCHSDGYPEEPGVGFILKHAYTDVAKIKKLLDLGDLSYLGPLAKSDPRLWDSHFYMNEGKEVPFCHYCRSYRDRKETNIDARDYNSIKEALEAENQDYNYFFIDGEWYYRIWDKGAIINLKTGEKLKKE